MKKYYRDALFDLRTSVNKNVAISLLLGLRSFDPIRPAPHPRGDPQADYQIYLDSLDISILEVISDLRESDRRKLEDAMKGEDQAKKDECKVRLTLADDQMRLAHRHLCDINYELAKGEQSILKVDHVATKTPENPYIEAASLDRWAKEKYKIDIFETADDKLVKVGTPVKAEAQNEEDASQLGPAVGKVKTNNLYVLLAFFVEAFAATASRFRENDAPNAIAIAEHFEAVAIAANNKNQLTGHDFETIRKVIAEAMLRKTQKQLKKSYINGVLQPIVLPEPRG